MRKIIIRILFAGFFILGGISIYSFSVIYRGVDKISSIARNEFKGNSVESLIKLIESGNHSFAEKNTAIWALGQLADKRALPYLEKIEIQADDSFPCNRQLVLCRREIQKAIKWCRKGNMTSWMYRKIK